MERVCLRALLTVFILVWMFPASAGTVSQEHYPASRFGEPPADPAVFQKGELRRPAGLVVQDIQSEQKKRIEMGRASSPIRSTKFDSLVPDSRKGVQEVALIAGDLGFFPKTVFVNRDIPVRLFVTGASENTLCLMLDSFNVRKQIRSKRIEEIGFTPNQPGIYRFYCPVNNMEGQLVVRDFMAHSP